MVKKYLYKIVIILFGVNDDYYTLANTKVEALKRFYNKLKDDLEADIYKGISYSKFVDEFGSNIRRVGSSNPYGNVYS